MKLYELFYVDEARKHSLKNPKLIPNNAVVDTFENTSDEIADTRNLFVSFTEIDKLGINPNSKYDTPIGIYAYPAEYVVNRAGRDKQYADNLPFAGDSAYLNMFNARGNIINLDDSNKIDEIWKPLEEAFVNLFNGNRSLASDEMDECATKAVSKARVKTNGGRFWYTTFLMAQIIANHKEISTPVAWNLLFRKAGIDGFVDMGNGIIHDNEPTQAVFFSIRGIKVIDRVRNKYHPESEKLGQHKATTNKEESARISNMTPSELNEFIANNPYSIKYVKNPSVELQCLVVEKLTSAIRNIKNPSPEAQLAAVSRTGATIKFIKNPTPAAIETALLKSNSNIQYVKRIPEDIKRVLVKHNPEALRYLRHPSAELQKEAIMAHPMGIEYCPIQTNELKEFAVRHNPKSIIYIKNPGNALQQFAFQLVGKKGGDEAKANLYKSLRSALGSKISTSLVWAINGEQFSNDIKEISEMQMKPQFFNTKLYIDWIKPAAAFMRTVTDEDTPAAQDGANYIKGMIEKFNELAKQGSKLNKPQPQQ